MKCDYINILYNKSFLYNYKCLKHIANHIADYMKLNDLSDLIYFVSHYYFGYAVLEPILNIDIYTKTTLQRSL